jgi:hypothetical protein
MKHGHGLIVFKRMFHPLGSFWKIDFLPVFVKQKTQCSGRRHIVLFPFLPTLDHSTANGKVSLQRLYGDE